MLLIYLLKSIILNSLFGKISLEVKEATDTYFMIVTQSIPFLAMYNCGAAVIVLLLARNKENELYVIGYFKEKFDFEMVKRILSIGLPFGIENGMFYFGRLIVLSVVSLFGTASIAANAVGGTINMFEVLPGVV